MLLRRALAVAPRAARSFAHPYPQTLLQLRFIIPRAQFTTSKCLQADQHPDPEMNNNYINPPRIKRSHRDPYADWDDKQEMRNFGEPVHEDNDVLGVFSLHDYTHMSVGRGLVLWAAFISSVVGLYAIVTYRYPGKPSAPREFENGLFEELGGAGAVRARMAGDPADEEQLTGELHTSPQVSRDVVLNQNRKTAV